MWKEMVLRVKYMWEEMVFSKLFELHERRVYDIYDIQWSALWMTVDTDFVA